MKAQQELPQYKSRTSGGTVRAVKIAAIEIHADKSATIVPADKNFSPFKTPPGWAEGFRGNEEDKGYFLQYHDSVEGWISARDFEADAYLLVTDV